MSIQGKNCKRQWFLNYKLIHGCTTAPDPEGNALREWCRLEDDDSGNKNWDFCVEDMDFDQVRAVISDFYE